MAHDHCGLAFHASEARGAFDPYFFFGGDPAGEVALAKPPAVAAPAEAFSLSFFGFLASLLLRICPLAIARLLR